MRGWETPGSVTSLEEEGGNNTGGRGGRGRPGKCLATTRRNRRPSWVALANFHGVNAPVTALSAAHRSGARRTDISGERLECGERAHAHARSRQQVRAHTHAHAHAHTHLASINPRKGRQSCAVTG